MLTAMEPMKQRRLPFGRELPCWEWLLWRKVLTFGEKELNPLS
jgi:hypothetical protein